MAVKDRRMEEERSKRDGRRLLMRIDTCTKLAIADSFQTCP